MECLPAIAGNERVYPVEEYSTGTFFHFISVGLRYFVNLKSFGDIVMIFFAVSRI